MEDIHFQQILVTFKGAADVIFKFKDTIISVTISPSNSFQSPDLGENDRPLNDHVIELLSKSVRYPDFGQGFELGQKGIELRRKAVKIVLDAVKDHFSELTSPEEPVEGKQLLSQLLFPKVLHFRLEGFEGRATMVPIAPSEANGPVIIHPAFQPRFKKTLDLLPDLPRCTPEEVVVTKLLLGGELFAVATVQVDGEEQEMLCKANGSPDGATDNRLRRELELLGNILRVFLYPNVIRVPRILGYVEHKETKQILGFIRQWIPGHKLSEINAAQAKEETRQKWILQISESVEQLHKHGFVWGDAAPDRIVIDENDDAWLDGFGGGYSSDWIDEYLQGTKEGDKQGLGKIVDMLK
ncbi:hypothetical protein IL306_006711 [Fusarium sp. DS 682]|nr:hypothetical protein IL306_006711 [Fusarium sp. DS 682]